MCECVIKFVCYTISRRTIAGISPNLQLGTSVPDRDRLITFGGQKVKGEGHSEIYHAAVMPVMLQETT